MQHSMHTVFHGVRSQCVIARSFRVQNMCVYKCVSLMCVYKCVSLCVRVHLGRGSHMVTPGLCHVTCHVTTPGLSRCSRLSLCRLHVCVSVCARLSMSKCAHMCTCMRFSILPTHTQTHTRSHAHTDTHTDTQTHTLTRTHAHTHAHTYTHTHIHTHTQASNLIRIPTFPALLFSHFCDTFPP
jgi:hypothetical protein